MKIKLMAVSTFLVAAMASQTVSAQATDEYNPLEAKVGSGAPIGLVPSSPTHALTLSGGSIFYSNGVVSNSPGTGAGGADESELFNITLGTTTLGFGHQTSATNRVADDFVLSNSTTLNQAIFYAYQTGSTTTSTITGVTLQIWNGKPGEPGSTVVWGDTSTNILDSSEWTGIYRIAEGDSGSTLRPIMATLVNIGTLLPAGTYWLDWDANGTLGSGPWAPPIAVTNGDPNTGDGLQNTGGTWNQLVDTASASPTGLPFELVGNAQATAIPSLSKFGQLALILLVFAVFVVRRQGHRTA